MGLAGLLQHAHTSRVDDGVGEPAGLQVLLSLALPLQDTPQAANTQQPAPQHKQNHHDVQFTCYDTLAVQHCGYPHTVWVSTVLMHVMSWHDMHQEALHACFAG
jgi:hypothetical protein